MLHVFRIFMFRPDFGSVIQHECLQILIVVDLTNGIAEPLLLRPFRIALALERAYAHAVAEDHGLVEFGLKARQFG